MPAASKLEMNLLGMFSLRLGANEIRIPSRKGCALVGYLALVDGHEATREQLLGLLWSDSSEDKAPYAWMVTFAPADDPQVAVAVLVEQTGVGRDEISGNGLAGPIARSVMEAVISE